MLVWPAEKIQACLDDAARGRAAPSSDRRPNDVDIPFRNARKYACRRESMLAVHVRPGWPPWTIRVSGAARARASGVDVVCPKYREAARVARTIWLTSESASYTSSYSTCWRRWDLS
jgi:hypothetical protein